METATNKNIEIKYEVVSEVPPRRTARGHIVGFRKKWANDVLALAKANPNKWLKLEPRMNSRYMTAYLKPLGMSATIRDVNQQDHTGVIYVCWEEN